MSLSLSLTNGMSLGGRASDLVALYANLAAPDADVALVKTSTEYRLYSPLHVDGYWALETLTGDEEQRPRARDVVRLADVYHVRYDSFTISGTFATDLTGETYFGGVQRVSASTGAYVEKQITVDGESNVIEVVYAKRANANHIAVTIDGSGALVDLPTNGAGEKYIDPYDPSTSVIPNQFITIATLPAGTYTIRLTNSTQKNASATSGNLFYPGAIVVTGGTAGRPGGDRTHAPQWVTGEAVSTNWQRWNAGITYRATGSGTTGATAPTHTSGTVSDGTVSWAVVTTNRYNLFEESYLRDASEPFYALWLALNGNDEEDFGGNIHANQTLDSLTVYVDDVETAITDLEPVYGSSIRVEQVSSGYHTADAVTPVATFTTNYTAEAGGKFSYSCDMEALFAGTMGVFFPMMMPVYAYLPTGFRYVARQCLVPGAGSARPSSYYGQSNPHFGDRQVTQLGCLVQLGSDAGSSGTPAADTSGTMMLALVAETTVASMGDWAWSNPTAYWDMNTSGVDASSGGFSGHLVKGYFRASDGTVDVNLAANQTLSWSGTYYCTLFDGADAGQP